MKLIIMATDGAGNVTSLDRTVIINENNPPQITKIQILDSKGFNLGAMVTQLAEGRQIILDPVASDFETGIDMIRMFYKIEGTEEIRQIGVDEAAPFQFHFKIPSGNVGNKLIFMAKAVDTDGFESETFFEQRVCEYNVL